MFSSKINYVNKRITGRVSLISFTSGLAVGFLADFEGDFDGVLAGGLVGDLTGNLALRGDDFFLGVLTGILTTSSTPKIREFFFRLRAGKPRLFS